MDTVWLDFNFMKSIDTNDFAVTLFLLLGTVPGALIRWQISNIFLVNILGTFILGFVFGLQLGDRFKLLLCIGFCGSLTTFSGWIFQCFLLLKDNLILQAFGMIALYLGVGLGVSVIGFHIGRKLSYLAHFQSN